MDKRCSPERIPRSASFERRTFRSWAVRPLTAVGLLLALSWPLPEAAAQFSARGRTRAPQGTPSSSQKAPSRPAQTKRTETAPRDEVLIERYEKLIIDEPGEEVPLVRLAELVRTRDGNLEKVLEALEKKASTAENTYPVLVAWAGMLAQDERPQEAITKLESATHKEPDRHEAWLLLGRLQKSLDRSKDARASFERALPRLSGPEKNVLVRSLRDLCLDLGDLPGAKKYHQLLLKDAQGNLFLRGELGRELLARGKVQEAISELEGVARAARGDAREEAPALRDLGQAQLEGNRLDDAIASLSRASKLAVNAPGLRVAIDTILADAHRKRGTLGEFLTALSSSATTASRAGLLGRLYEEEGQTDQAISAYEKALDLDPRDIDVRMRLVRLLEVTGDIEAAAREYGSLVKSAPDDIQLSLRYIEMLLSQGQRKQAILQWDKTELRTRSDPEAGLMLLDIAERLEESERVARVLARLSQSTLRDPRLLVELGSRYYQKGDVKTARNIWKRLVTLHSNKAQGHVLLGEVLIDHEAAEDGVAELEKAALLAPDDINVQKSLALGLERVAAGASRGARSTYEQKALEHFQRVLKLAVSGARTELSAQAEQLARRHIVRLWNRRGDLEAELVPLEKKLGKSPPDLEAGRLLAEGYLAQRRDAAAIRTLKTIVEHAPGDRQVLVQLEAAYTRARDYDAAIGVLERLVEADPRRAREYYDRMARAAALKNDRSGALRYAELAVQKNPNDPAAQAQLGDLYLEQGKPEEAEAAYRKALAQDDRLHSVSLRLEELLAKTKRAPESLELLSHVIRTAREHEIIRRATRRSLSLSVPLGKTRSVENILRPLAIGRPEQPLYRTLLLEVLSAQMYPLLLTAGHGAENERADAEAKLKELSDRSTGPLLTALSGDNKGEQQTAISLLAHGSTSSAGRALLAFAEGSADPEQRLLAVLALGQMKEIDFTDRLIALFQTNAEVRRGHIAQAALWVVSRRGDSRKNEALLFVLEKGDPEMRASAALGLGDSESMSQPTLERTRQGLLAVVQKPSNGPVARAAAALALGKLAERGLLQGAAGRQVSEQLQQVAQARSALLTQAALRGLSLFPSDPEARHVIAQGLLDEDPQVRKTATVAAVDLGRPKAERTSSSLLPASLSTKELSAHLQVRAALDRTPLTSSKDRHEALVLLSSDIEKAAKVGLRAAPEQASTILTELSATPDGMVFGQLLTAEDLEKKPRAPVTESALRAAAALRKNLLPELIPLAESPQVELRLLALRLLSPDDGPLALGALESSLLDEDAAVHGAALSALTRSGEEAALHAIGLYLDDEHNWARRRRTAEALGELYLRTQRADAKTRVRALLRRLTLDSSPLVAQEASAHLQGETE